MLLAVEAKSFMYHGVDGSMRQYMMHGAPRLMFVSACLLLCQPHAGFGQVYSWMKVSPVGTVESRFEPPSGFIRIQAEAGSYSRWLRGLPLKEGTGVVLLHTGSEKPDQAAHCAVIDIDTGTKDLQQCADAVIRLRAEYLFSNPACHDEIEFKFTSGDAAKWSDYREGVRPLVSGNLVGWEQSAVPDSSYGSFRRYLDLIFMYAGTGSLCRDLNVVADPLKVEPGDVFIQAWGHAILVIDVAENRDGDRVFLLAQSYMPAQDIHILVNPGGEPDPWYKTRSTGNLVTPEWTFDYENLYRFPVPDCEH